MPKKQSKESVSIRIPANYYEKLKEFAESNKRPVVSELVIILDDFLSNKNEARALRRLKAIRKTAGIIKHLPPGNYATTIDDELYGKIEK